MVNMYKFGETSDVGALVPSKAYVDYIAKQILDVIIDHNNNALAHDKLKKTKNYKLDNNTFNIKEVSTESSANNAEIRAVDIKTDSNNVFVSQQTLASLKERPTLLEVKQLINNARDDISGSLQKRFDDMINMPDAMEKIKTLIGIIKEDNNLQELMMSLSNKVNRDDYVGHVASELHLCRNDRKALNVLIHLCSKGFADWEAGPEEMNCIRNKPEALPADGGNADTVGGYSPEALINKKSSDLIIGLDNGKYPREQVDLCVDEDYSNISELKDFLESMTSGKIEVRPGVYVFDTLEICKDRKESSYDLTLSGAGNCSIFKVDQKMIINQHVRMRDLCFMDSYVHIGSNCEIDKCHFERCSIFLEGSVSTSILNSNFKDCTFTYVANCTGLFMVYNRLINCIGVQYIGKNNVIHNNIII